jgi:transketolase
MRPEFFSHLFELMENDYRIIAVTGDLGYIGFDKIRDLLPGRFINTGASEQAMMGIATGLALSGKIPIVYSITPFLLYRGFETLRTYVNHENIPVILIGSGREKDYAHDGFSHDASDDERVMHILDSFHSVWPETTEEMKQALETAIHLAGSAICPTYINLKR